MPVPNPTSDPGGQTPKFTNAKLAQIVWNACPAGWKKDQVDANLHHLSLAAQARYYTSLGDIESDKTLLIKPIYRKEKRHTNAKTRTPLT
jgi:hypothetical protein